MTKERFTGTTLRCPNAPWYIFDNDKCPSERVCVFKHDELPEGYKTLNKIVDLLNNVNKEACGK